MNKEGEDIGPGIYKFINDIEPTAEELEKFKDIRSTIQKLWCKNPTKFTITLTPTSYKLFQDYITEM